MIQSLGQNELADIVDSIKNEWNINVSLVEAGFSSRLPYAKNPSNGIVYFPKRIAFTFLLYHLIQEGWASRNQLFYGNHLVNLNEKIVAAFEKKDIDTADEIKKTYCDELKEYSELVTTFQNINYNPQNTMLFFLYHELTHVRIAQQPSFFEEKKKELSQRISLAQPAIQKSMKISLKKYELLEEEVVCDLEACKILRNAKKSESEFKETLMDIVHTINVINSLDNLRDSYIRAKLPKLFTYCSLTHSKKTKISISRFTFIQNFWKDLLLLNGRELLRDIFNTALSLSLSQDTLDFCKTEFEKEDNFNYDKQKAKMIEEEICELENYFVNLIISKSNC